MAIIDQREDVVTLVNVFTVRPEKQDTLVQLLIEATNKTMRHLPGYFADRAPLFRQREAVEDVPCRERQILTPSDGITHRRCRMIAARLIVPEVLSSLRIERDYVTVA